VDTDSEGEDEDELIRAEELTSGSESDDYGPPVSVARVSSSTLPRRSTAPKQGQFSAMFSAPYNPKRARHFTPEQIVEHSQKRGSYKPGIAAMRENARLARAAHQDLLVQLGYKKQRHLNHLKRGAEDANRKCLRCPTVGVVSGTPKRVGDVVLSDATVEEMLQSRL
jgi:hypothetical protein